MKNIIITLVFSVFLMSLSSCEKPDFTNKEKANETNTTSNMAGKATGIYAMHIDNGINCNCVNNILVFPNWDTFWNTVRFLENKREQHVTNFVNNAPPNLTDLQFEAYAKSKNYHEEQPYLDFEAAFQFASLRKKIYDQETNWLKNLGHHEVWNPEMDPDNHYVWYEDRVLLNEQAEVIVKDSLGNDIIYKFYEGGYVKITDNAYKILQAFNTTGPVTSSKVLYVEPCLQDGQLFPWDNFPYSSPCGGGSGDPGNDDDGNPPPSCKTSNEIRKYFSTGDDTKIKTVDKFEHNTFWGNDRVKSKTKYYRWHNAPWPFTGGAWLRGRTTITAGLTANYGMSCGNGQLPFPDFKTRMASKVKVKWYGPEMNDSPEVIDNAIYGTHKRRQDVTKIIDHYDGDVIP